MTHQRKLMGIILFLLILLFFRDVPYVNIFVINRVWMLYLLLIFYLLPFRNIAIKYIGVAASFMLSLLFTLLSFPVGAEILGVIIYVCFWVIALYKAYLFFRST